MPDQTNVVDLIREQVDLAQQAVVLNPDPETAVILQRILANSFEVTKYYQNQIFEIMEQVVNKIPHGNTTS